MILKIIGGFVASVIIGAIILYSFHVYNQLIRLKKDVEKSWSNIDVILQQRSDEIPNLIDTVEQYVDHERETILQSVQKRYEDAEAASTPKEQAQADNMLQGALSDMFALAEDYPELKANENFNQLQDRISSLEERIADRREHYNQSATTYNTRIKQIPYVFVANQMNLEERELYEADEGSTEYVNVSEEFDGDTE